MITENDVTLQERIGEEKDISETIRKFFSLVAISRCITSGSENFINSKFIKMKEAP